jgi:pimeloyl-ACP methyl ester carboxylesterase
MPSIKANGLSMNYYEFGAENPVTPIVLVHGFTAQAKWMAPLAKLLVTKAKCHVFTLDLAGHGLTQKREEAPGTDPVYSIPSFEQDLAAWLKAIKLRKASLLGHSMGGMIAQLFAKNHPESLEKLILLCTAPNVEVGLLNNLLLSIASPRLIVNALISRAYPAEYPKEKIKETVKESLACTSSKAIKTGIDQMRPKNFTSKSFLSEIETPTLVIAGENDRSLGYAASVFLSHNIPRSILYTIASGNHEAQILHTEEVAEQVLKFIQ